MSVNRCSIFVSSKAFQRLPAFQGNVSHVADRQGCLFLLFFHSLCIIQFSQKVFLRGKHLSQVLFCNVIVSVGRFQRIQQIGRDPASNIFVWFSRFIWRRMDFTSREDTMAAS